MSPEQAQGKEVDSRSDIFSLGSVLYEMVTGSRAFSGENKVSTLAAILLRDEPKPISELVLGAPVELEGVIGRCLDKDPGRRFQQMSELKIALGKLQEESDSGALAPAMSPPRRCHRSFAWAGGAVLAAVLGLAVWFVAFRPPVAVPQMKVGALNVSPGVQTQPAISPDGKQVAFVWNGPEARENYDIYVQLADETTPRRLTNGPEPEYRPVWSPDGLRIAFLRATLAGMELIVVPSAGGVEKTLHVSQIDCSWLGSLISGREFCGVSWSPNGRFLTFVDKESPESPRSIFLLDIGTREVRKLTTPPPGLQDGFSAFSRDGRMLAFSRDAAHPMSNLYVLPLSDKGEPEADPLHLTHDNEFIEGIDWTADSRSIIFASRRGGVFALWRVARSGGDPVPLPIGSNGVSWRRSPGPETS